MSNYTKTTDFEAKDSLPTGDSGKIIRGSEFETEFDAISTAISTKADTAGPTFTGTLTFETISDGTIGVTAFVDEDNMASNSATLVPTQQSVKAYVDAVTTELNAQDLDFQADSGGALSIDLDSEALTLTGGTGIDTSGALNEVTFAIDSTVATLTGTQTLTNKTLTAPTISGNLTTDGNIDGRDVATDGAKLDGIEVGATADQTAAEIRTLVDSATDSNVFTDADHTKLDGIEASATADQTDAEIRAAVEAATDSNVFTDADHTKLDGIEASADVTDTTNVTAAGALMDSELTDITAVKALDQGVATTDSPTFAGLTTTADVSFGDNDKAIFGAGSDLQIYHDGSASYIKDLGTGPLAINTNGSEIMLTGQSGSEYMVRAIQDGAVELYYDASKKLATTSTGIDVTGTVAADGLTSALTSSGANVTVASLKNDGTGANTKADLDFFAASTKYATISGGYGASAAEVDIKVGSAPSLVAKFSAGGDISFYEDTGTTAKLFWDASAESLGIGTSSPATTLTVEGSGANGIELNRNGADATQSARLFFDSSTSGYAVTNVAGALAFNSGATAGVSSGTERMRIDSSGNVGINATTIAANGLQIGNTSSTDTEQLYLYSNKGTFSLEVDGGNNAAGTIMTYSWANGGQGNLRFKNASGEVARLDASGNLLVGTTNTANVANATPNVVTDQSFGINNTVNKAAFQVDRISFDGSNYYVLNASAIGVKLINGATAWTTQSDETLKENITELTDVLPKVQNLRCVSYNLKSQSSDNVKLGFIAQDWQTEFPEVVHDEPSDGTLGINYTETIPVLLKAIQEQNEIINNLRARVAQLETN